MTSLPFDVELERHRFTVAEYEQMGRAGVLTEDDRVELLDGEIVQMTPIGSAHSGLVKRLIRIFTSRLGERTIISAQDPLWLNDYSEPEPDLMLLQPRSDFYSSSHPTADDALLVIEVAETSLAVDRGVKAPMYAAAGVREVWVIDVSAQKIHVHRAPERTSYSDVRTLTEKDQLTPLAFPDLTLRAAEIFGA